MPISRYDVPANYDYMGLPYQEIVNAGMLRQRRFDEDKDELAKLQGMIAIKADPKHEAYRDELVKSYNKDIADITNRYLTTGDPTVLRDATKLKQRYASDAERLSLESNYQNWLLAQKDAQEAKQKNIYAEMYDPYLKLQAPEQGVTPFRYSGMKTKTDFYKPASEMMKDIAESGAKSGAYSLDEAGNIIGRKSGWEAVFREDVNRVAKANTDAFLSHPESQYFKDLILSSNPKISPDELRAEAYNYLRGVGEKQVFKKSEFDSDFKYAPGYIAEDKAAAQTQYTPALVSNLPEGEYTPQPWFSSAYDSKTGKLEFKADNSETAKIKEGRVLMPDLTEAQNKERFVKNIAEAAKVTPSILKDFSTRDPKLGYRQLDLSNEKDLAQIAKNYSQLQQNLQSKASTGHKVEGKYQQSLTKDLFYDENSKSFGDVETYTFKLPSGIVGSFEDYAKSQDLNVEEFKELLKTARVTQDVPGAMSTPGAMKMTYDTPKGVKSVIFNDNNETRKAFLIPTKEASKLEEIGQEGMTSFIDTDTQGRQHSMYSVTKVVPNKAGTLQYQTFVGQLNSDGTPLIQNGVPVMIPLQDYKQRKLGQYYNSTYSSKLTQGDKFSDKRIEEEDNGQ